MLRPAPAWRGVLRFDMQRVCSAPARAGLTVSARKVLRFDPARWVLPFLRGRCCASIRQGGGRSAPTRRGLPPDPIRRGWPFRETLRTDFVSFFIQSHRKRCRFGTFCIIFRIKSPVRKKQCPILCDFSYKVPKNRGACVIFVSFFIQNWKIATYVASMARSIRHMAGQ